jgi:hypothetical protein
VRRLRKAFPHKLQRRSLPSSDRITHTRSLARALVHFCVNLLSHLHTHTPTHALHTHARTHAHAHTNAELQGCSCRRPALVHDVRYNRPREDG